MPRNILIFIGLIAVARAKPQFSGYNYSPPSSSSSSSSSLPSFSSSASSVVNPQNIINQPLSSAPQNSYPGNQQPSSVVSHQIQTAFPPQNIIQSNTPSILQQNFPPLNQYNPQNLQSHQFTFTNPIYQQLLVNPSKILIPQQAAINNNPTTTSTSQFIISQPNLLPGQQQQFFIPNLQLAQNIPLSGNPIIGQQQIVNPISPSVVGLPSSVTASGQTNNLVTKHVYVHVAPEEPPQSPQIISVPSLPAKKTYRIIFIKAPSASSQRHIVQLPPQPQPTEEKTLVYVLVNKPAPPQVVVSPPSASEPSKPEVYFIKYKAKEALVPSSSISSASSESSSNSPNTQNVNSGESSSSAFANGLANINNNNIKYGPPGLQN